ncbi:hypothetical protein MTO96_040476 [Rhipicephalus appendiculatus]
MARLRIGTRIGLMHFEYFHQFGKAEDEVTMCARNADLRSDRPSNFEPLTNVLWLQHIADWLASQYADGAPMLLHREGQNAFSVRPSRLRCLLGLTEWRSGHILLS